MKQILTILLSAVIQLAMAAPILVKGELKPLFLPISLSTEDYGQLYLVGSVKADGTAELMPVNYVESGVPCVVKAEKNTEVTLPEDIDLPIVTDTLALWDATILRGDYSTYSWMAISVDSITFTPAEELNFIVCDPSDLHLTVNTENRCVQRYLAAAHYSYEDSAIVEQFRWSPPSRTDWPQEVVIPTSDGNAFRMMNLTPGVTHNFSYVDSNGATYSGDITVTGLARMIGINTPNLNMRDLGGWQVGKYQRVRYGMLFRSAELNGSIPLTQQEIDYLKEDIGIKAELDLRYDNEHEKHSYAGISAYGFTKEDGTYYWACANDYSAESMMTTETRNRLREEFLFIVDNLRQGRPVNFHCHYGVDRTGILSMLLLGVLGVDIDQIYKDHELSTFGPHSWTSLKEELKERVDVVTNIDGATLQEKFQKFFIDSLGVTNEDITAFRSMMLYTADDLVSVPRIDITFGDGTAWNRNSWIGMDGKDTWIDATISIDGGGRYPDLEPTSILIKGRGNTSWTQSSSSKNPYNFKFSSKKSVLGLKKGKKWTLLSNKLTGSMLTNALGLKIAEEFECAAPNHIVPIELYCNGSYRGHYNLTEKVGFSNNSVDIDDETYAAMIELDKYNDPDEPLDYSNIIGLPVKIKEPDFLEDAATISYTYEEAINAINSMIESVERVDGSYVKIIDMDKMLRYMAALELMDSQELTHPKSVKLYTENLFDEPDASGYDPTPWVFGPVWDCDWAFGRQESYTATVHNRTNFYYGTDTDFLNDVLRGNGTKDRRYSFFYHLLTGSEEAERGYYALWYDFMHTGKVEKLQKYIDDYYNFASKSLYNNRYNATSERDATDYGAQVVMIKDWLRARADFIWQNMKERNTRLGDVNHDGLVTMSDANIVVSHFLGSEQCNVCDADINDDGVITMNDANEIVNIFLGAER